MKRITLNYRYEERRSLNYQSVSVALEASVAIDAADDRKKALRAIRQHVRAEVRRDVTQALNDITSVTASATTGTIS